MRARLRRFSVDRPRWGWRRAARRPAERAGASPKSGSADCGARRGPTRPAAPPQEAVDGLIALQTPTAANCLSGEIQRSPLTRRLNTSSPKTEPAKRARPDPRPSPSAPAARARRSRRPGTSPRRERRQPTSYAYVAQPAPDSTTCTCSSRSDQSCSSGRGCELQINILVLLLPPENQVQTRLASRCRQWPTPVSASSVLISLRRTGRARTEDLPHETRTGRSVRCSSRSLAKSCSGAYLHGLGIDAEPAPPRQRPRSRQRGHAVAPCHS